MPQWNDITVINPVLPTDTVILWLVKIDSFYPQLQILRGFLNQTEREKADRFHFEIHQKRYTISQGLLRFLLAQYLSNDPKAIQFFTNRYGKPFVDKPIHFNISHSNEFALYAFSANSELGVDIEFWRERKYLDGIIDSNFSVREQKIYHHLNDSLKIASFYQGWTCNEAYIKALGMGLSYPLQNFSVEMDPGKPTKLLDTQSQILYLTSLPCPENYSAALALEYDHFAIECYHFTPTLLPKL